jgi:hypothetical protein
MTNDLWEINGPTFQARANHMTPTSRDKRHSQRHLPSVSLSSCWTGTSKPLVFRLLIWLWYGIKPCRASRLSLLSSPADSVGHPNAGYAPHQDIAGLITDIFGSATGSNRNVHTVRGLKRIANTPMRRRLESITPRAKPSAESGH